MRVVDAVVERRHIKIHSNLCPICSTPRLTLTNNDDENTHRQVNTKPTWNDDCYCYFWSCNGAGFNEETLRGFEELMLEACRIINSVADEKILHHMAECFSLKSWLQRKAKVFCLRFLPRDEKLKCWLSNQNQIRSEHKPNPLKRHK